MSFLGWLAQPAVFPWVALVVGLAAGSFLNVVIHRLPKMMERDWRAQCAELEGRTPPEAGAPYDLVRPRSHCPACGHRLTLLENVPIVSWLLLRGRCSACGARIGLRYPLVELAAGLAAWYAATRWGLTLAGLGAILFCWALLAAAAIDLDTHLLPDDITLPLVWAGLLVHLGGGFPGISLAQAVIGAVAGYLFLWSVYWAFRLATGKEGMGHGDFKLLAAIGAWLGWQALPLVVLLSSIVGAVVGLSLIAFGGHAREKPIPFGPYLAAAGVIALFWGEAISRQWLPILA